MGSSPDAVQGLGAFLTRSEAKDLADRLEAGATLTEALRSVSAARRVQARDLIMKTRLDDQLGSLAVVLRAIQGARSVVTRIDTCWTLPGQLAQTGALTSSVAHLVLGATFSVTCSTFNFQRSSELWQALRAVAMRPGVTVRVYLDTTAAEPRRTWVPPSTAEVAAQLAPATVFRTKTFNGRLVRNHAKFVAVDHRFLLVTSANFSRSAEYDNVEFGVIIDHPNLTEAVEREMRNVEPAIYEQVRMESRPMGDFWH